MMSVMHIGLQAGEQIMSNESYFEIIEVKNRIFLLDKKSGRLWLFDYSGPEPKLIPVPLTD